MEQIKIYEPIKGISYKQQMPYSQHHPYIKEASNEVIRQSINVALGKAIQSTGFNIEGHDYDHILNEIENEIIAKYGSLRISEVSLAFERGIRGLYGEYMGNSVISYSMFLRNYFNDPERHEALAEIAPQIAALSNEEKKRLNFESGERLFNKAISDIKECGWTEDEGNQVYEHLIDVGTLQKGYGNQFLAQAKENVLKELRVNLTKENNATVAKYLKKCIDEIESKHNTDQVIVRAKKIAVNTYLRSII